MQSGVAGRRMDCQPEIVMDRKESIVDGVKMMDLLKRRHLDESACKLTRYAFISLQY